MTTRRPSTIRCPVCDNEKTIGKMTAQISKFERQILTECRDCQMAASKARSIANAAKRTA